MDVLTFVNKTSDFLSLSHNICYLFSLFAISYISRCRVKFRLKQRKNTYICEVGRWTTRRHNCDNFPRPSRIFPSLYCVFWWFSESLHEIRALRHCGKYERWRLNPLRLRLFVTNRKSVLFSMTELRVQVTNQNKEKFLLSQGKVLLLNFVTNNNLDKKQKSA